MLLPAVVVIVVALPHTIKSERDMCMAGQLLLYSAMKNNAELWWCVPNIELARSTAKGCTT